MLPSTTDHASRSEAVSGPSPDPVAAISSGCRDMRHGSRLEEHRRHEPRRGERESRAPIPRSSPKSPYLLRLRPRAGTCPRDGRRRNQVCGPSAGGIDATPNELPALSYTASRGTRAATTGHGGVEDIAQPTHPPLRATTPQTIRARWRVVRPVIATVRVPRGDGRVIGDLAAVGCCRGRPRPAAADSRRPRLLPHSVVVGAERVHGDLLRRRRTFMLSIGLFTVGSLAVGVARSEIWMIAARGPRRRGPRRSHRPR